MTDKLHQLIMKNDHGPIVYTVAQTSLIFNLIIYQSLQQFSHYFCGHINKSSRKTVGNEKRCTCVYYWSVKSVWFVGQ